MNKELLNTTKLPYEWVVYLYFKEVYNSGPKRSRTSDSYQEVCSLKTLNDLVYFLQLMECEKTEDPTNEGRKLNLDANDYVIMKKGIEPIWEDPRNSEGGMFTMKINHEKGYGLWSTIVMHILGGTLAKNMTDINGITSQFIPDVNGIAGTTYSFLKVWDGRPNRNLDQFMSILPDELAERIKGESRQYLPVRRKKNYGKERRRNNTNYGGGFKS